MSNSDILRSGQRLPSILDPETIIIPFPNKKVIAIEGFYFTDSYTGVVAPPIFNILPAENNIKYAVDIYTSIFLIGSTGENEVFYNIVNGVDTFRLSPFKTNQAFFQTLVSTNIYCDSLDADLSFLALAENVQVQIQGYKFTIADI